MSNNIAKQIWLLDLVRRWGRISLADVQKEWRRSAHYDGADFSERTFHRYREKINETFGIEIRCDKHDMSRYYIVEDEDGSAEKEVKAWLLSTIAVDNMLYESRDMKDRIEFEDIPSGQEYLTPIIGFMRDSVKIEFTYYLIESNRHFYVRMSPYFIKVKDQRWYVIGKVDGRKRSDSMRVYALDRISDLSGTDETFVYPGDFNPREFFQYSCGVYHLTEKPELVSLKVTASQREFTRRLKLHPSQKEVVTEEDHSIFQYFLVPDFNFVMEIASKGDKYEVLEPKTLRDEVAAYLKDAADIYGKK